MRGNSRSRVAGSSREETRLGSDTYPVAAPHEADDGAKALLRLRSRRLILVEPDPIRGEALAAALRRSGAIVAIVRSHADLEPARALDADAVLVDASELASGTAPLVEALRRHPRVRWATVIGVRDADLWSTGPLEPTLLEVAIRVGEAVAPAVELAVRAKGKLPRDTRLEPFGLNRLLRVLADTQRTLGIELSGDWGSAALELGEGRLFAARAHLTGSARTLSNAEALAALLELSAAHVRMIESSGDTPRSWNVPLAVALSRAAKHCRGDVSGEVPAVSAVEEDRPRPSVLPTRPQIALAEAMAMAEVTEPAEEARASGLGGDDDPFASGTRPRSDLAITREMPLAEVLAVVDATVEKDEDLEPLGVAPAIEGPQPKRGRAAVAAAAGIAVLGCGLLAALTLRNPADGAPREAAIRGEARELPKAAAAAPAKLAEAPPSAPAQPALEAETIAPNAAEPSEPEPEAVTDLDSEADSDSESDQTRQRPGQLEQARELVKRARRHRRAGQLDLAEAAYDKALTHFADYPLALAGLARIALERKDAAEAVRRAEQLVALQPDRGANQLLLGDAYALRGNTGEAERAFRRAAELGNKTARKRLQSR